MTRANPGTFGPRARAALALGVVFALGLVVGIAYERHHRSPRWMSLSGPSGLSAAEAHQVAMADLRKALDLDDEQVAQIHEIMRKHHGAVERAWEELRPEVQAAMREVHVEIAEILRPEQRERFHEWLTRRRQEQGSEGSADSHHP